MNGIQAYITTHTVEAPGLYAAGVLNGFLRAGKRVLVLLPGGSSIQVAAAAHQALDRRFAGQLTYTLTDERYGEVGHSDSNWQQLRAAGLDFPAEAQCLPVLTGEAFAETVAAFDAVLQAQFQAADVVFGFFGMGEDGHTAGALPGSPALISQAYAVGYEAGPYQRITMTPQAIRHVDEAVLYVMGDNKRTQLTALRSTAEVAEQPAQVLKEIPHLVVCSDVL